MYSTYQCILMLLYTGQEFLCIFFVFDVSFSNFYICRIYQNKNVICIDDLAI
jgi:hypothetical protein